jgi:hypothetical protein
MTAKPRAPTGRPRTKKWKPSSADLRTFYRVRDYFGLPEHELIVLGEVACRIGWLGDDEHRRMVLVMTAVELDTKMTEEFLGWSPEELRQ